MPNPSMRPSTWSVSCRARFPGAPQRGLVAKASSDSFLCLHHNTSVLFGPWSQKVSRFLVPFELSILEGCHPARRLRQDTPRARARAFVENTLHAPWCLRKHSGTNLRTQLPGVAVDLVVVSADGNGGEFRNRLAQPRYVHVVQLHTRTTHSHAQHGAAQSTILHLLTTAHQSCT